MQSLAIKYRPQVFADVVEQGSIRQILEHQVKTKTHKHSYLFTGGAGTGKTTCARIFAHELNGRTGNPIEIDAASNNGVDNVRDIIDGAKFKSLDSPYKVYIVDECHMLSAGAWNAMLKLLEEPPAQTIFIFCTTDPQKVPLTILSRTQRYDFKRISHDGIIARLQTIMEAERASYYANLYEQDSTGYLAECADSSGAYSWSDESLAYIAQIADGGMRDAITLMDKCLSYHYELSIDSVIAALGTADYSWFLKLTEAVLRYNIVEALTLIDTAYQNGAELKQLMKQYVKVLVDLYKYYLSQKQPEFKKHIRTPLDIQFIDAWTKDDFLYVPEILRIIIRLNADIKWDGAPKGMIEATFVMLCEEETNATI